MKWTGTTNLSPFSSSVREKLGQDWGSSEDYYLSNGYSIMNEAIDQ